MSNIRPVVRVYVYPNVFVAALRTLGYIIAMTILFVAACALATAIK